jgi:hypothetical protein
VLSIAKSFGGFAMKTNDDQLARLGDLLVGAASIAAYLTELGWAGPEPVNPEDVYYLKRAAILPIGSTASGGGGKLIASKQRLARHADMLACGATALRDAS